MFKCVQCPSVFIRKENLLRHVNTHTGIRFPCTNCMKTFDYKSNLNRHIKNVHGIVNVSARLQPTAPIVDQLPRQRVIQFAPGITQKNIQLAPQILVPDVSAGGSNMMSEDEMCMAAMEIFERNEAVQDANTECYCFYVITLLSGYGFAIQKKDSILSSEELSAILYCEAGQKGEINDTTDNLPIFTSLNGATLRRLFLEYSEIQNSHARMTEWVSRAGTLSRQLNLEFRVFAMLMVDNHTDNSIPVDESIFQMTPQKFNFFKRKTIRQHTQYYIFMQLVYGFRRIADIESVELRRSHRIRWWSNAVRILGCYDFKGDTLDFMLERIENLI